MGKNNRDFMERSNRFSLLLLYIMAVVMSAMVASSVFAASTPIAPNNGTAPCTDMNDDSCNVCYNQTGAFSSVNLGQQMITQIFSIINKILERIESTFYKGIVQSTAFQNAINVAFLMYIAIYGVMITFNLASYRSGEIANRLVKLAIVYAMTSKTGWTFFATWIQAPVIGEMDQIIVDIANAGSGSGGSCSSAGQFSGSSGDPIAMSGNDYIHLSTGPLAMLFGPMTCVFAGRFVAGIVALLTTGFYGWILALLLLWGMSEFALMLMGAIVTYVKAVIGLVFLFGLAPIFFAFYLFQKSRALTMGWLDMVIGFALQPVMLFTFLAFYAGIIGSAVSNMFTDASGRPEDVCYVPWFTMPGLVQTYWFKFTNKYCGGSGAAGGQWIQGCNLGSGSMGDPLPPPVQTLNILYFLVLCILGKNFTKYIEGLSETLSGGMGGGVTTGDQVGSWFKNNIAGGRGPGSLLGSALKGGVKTGQGLLSPGGGSGVTVPKAPLRPPPNTTP